MNYFDAHNHLHDARLAPHRTEILNVLRGLPLAGAMVNGTREEDWEAVATLRAAVPWVRSSFGLHPWYAPARSSEWLEALREFLTADPEAGVGEIGLDRWIEDHDLADQTEVFLAQLALAKELNRVATIHCLRAWGALWDAIRTAPMPPRGFLLHAYGGPLEMIAGFVEHGAYFSFSPYFLHERKATQREAFRRIPEERLLVETDAPDLRPPEANNPRPLAGAEGEPINHPGNIDVAYAGLAQSRAWELPHLTEVVAQNYARFFGLSEA